MTTHVLPGSHLHIRTLAAGDHDTLTTILEGMSFRSRVARYHAGLPHLTPRMLRHLTDVAPGRHVALVAEQDGAPLGIVRWVREDATTAEIALEVIDAAHGRGVGRALLQAACVSAVDAGIERLVAYVTADNRPVHRWLHRHAAHREEDRFVIPLPGKLAAPIRPLRGSMGKCAPASWGRSESRPPVVHSSPPEADPATSSRPSCSGEAAPFPRTSSSTSSGPSRQRRSTSPRSTPSSHASDVSSVRS